MTIVTIVVTVLEEDSDSSLKENFRVLLTLMMMICLKNTCLKWIMFSEARSIQGYTTARIEISPILKPKVLLSQ